MNTRWIVGAIVALAACSTSEDRAHAKLMDVIEESVRLPEGALRFPEYSRYYAPTADQKIAVLYVFHGDHLKNMRELCRDASEATFPCTVSGKSRLVEPGNRLWLADSRDLPFMQGGGCGSVDFVYDPATSSHSVPQCNGSY